MEEFRIYEDKQFILARDLAKNKKTLYHYPFYIKNKKKTTYFLSVENIEEIGKTKRGKLEKVLDKINPEIRKSLKKANLSVDSAHLAICLAYIDRLTTPRISDLPSCAHGPRVE